MCQVLSDQTNRLLPNIEFSFFTTKRIILHNKECCKGKGAMSEMQRAEVGKLGEKINLGRAVRKSALKS